MSENPHMATNLAIEDKLIEEDRKGGGHRTKKEARHHHIRGVYLYPTPQAATNFGGLRNRGL
jgi:Bacterial antitoxin of type II TA system, VapB